MGSPDRPSCAASVECVEVYDLLGYRVGLSVVTAARGSVRSILRAFGPDTSAAAADLPRYRLAALAEGWEVSAEGEIVYRGDDFATALALLEWHLLTAAVGRQTACFAVHAAALRAPQREASLLLVGESGKGKTTLALALMSRGFAPFGDDVALVEAETLAVRAMRRAFHIRDGTWQAVATLGNTPTPASADALPTGYFVPECWATAGAPVRWVLFTEYRQGDAPRLAPLSPTDAVIRLLAHSATTARNRALALATAAALTERAECFAFRGGELAASVALIERLVAGEIDASALS